MMTIPQKQGKNELLLEWLSIEKFSVWILGLKSLSRSVLKEYRTASDS